MDEEWYSGESQTFDPNSSESPLSESESDPDFDPTKLDSSKMDYPEYNSKCIICSGANGFEYYISNSNPDCIKYEHWVCSVCDRQMRAKYRRMDDKDPVQPPCPACKAVEPSAPHRITPPWALPESRALRAKRREQRAQNDELEQAMQLGTPPSNVPKRVICASAAQGRAEGVGGGGGGAGPSLISSSSSSSSSSTTSVPVPALVPITYAQGQLPTQGQNPDAAIFKRNKYKKRRDRNERRRRTTVGHTLGHGPINNQSSQVRRQSEAPASNATDIQAQSNSSAIVSQERPSCSFTRTFEDDDDEEQEEGTKEEQQQLSGDLSSDSDYDNLFTEVPVKRRKIKKLAKNVSQNVNPNLADSDADAGSSGSITEMAVRDTIPSQETGSEDN